MMPSIGFKVFREKIESGEKRQTIRLMRKRPFKVGDDLYLFWNFRRKDCILLKKTVCLEAFYISFCYVPNFCGGGPALRIDRIKEKSYASRQMLPDEMDDLAKRDGFADRLEMAAWFYKTHGELGYKIFQVVRW